MKVLFVSSTNNKKGIGPILKMQGDSLRSHEIILDNFGIESGGFRGYLKARKLLTKCLKGDNYDIIHAHYGLSAIVALLARKKEILIVSFMGDDIVGSNLPDGSITKKSILIAWLNILFSKWFYSHSIVKSEEMLKKINHNKVTLIPNGVNINVFFPKDKTLARKELGIDPGIKLVIFVSDPSRVEKNYILADKAVSLLKNPKILIVPVFNCIHDNLPDYYNAADVLIMTSFHEGSPNVIKEAMACNCPIVSTDVGDVSWVIGNTEGCFITSFNSVDVSQKIKLAIDFRKKYGQTRGRERILELGLDSETIATRIIGVYKSALKIYE